MFQLIQLKQLKYILLRFEYCFGTLADGFAKTSPSSRANKSAVSSSKGKSFAKLSLFFNFILLN